MGRMRSKVRMCESHSHEAQMPLDPTLYPAELVPGLEHLGDAKVEARENSCTGRGGLW